MTDCSFLFPSYGRRLPFGAREKSPPASRIHYADLPRVFATALPAYLLTRSIISGQWHLRPTDYQYPPRPMLSREHQAKGKGKEVGRGEVGSTPCMRHKYSLSTTLSYLRGIHKSCDHAISDAMRGDAMQCDAMRCDAMRWDGMGGCLINDHTCLVLSLFFVSVFLFLYELVERVGNAYWSAETERERKTKEERTQTQRQTHVLVTNCHAYRSRSSDPP